MKSREMGRTGLKNERERANPPPLCFCSRPKKDGLAECSLGLDHSGQNDEGPPDHSGFKAPPLHQRVSSEGPR